ncbi:SAICAR synthase-like protein [Dothidotthia symphoricarpi CBS 119687]|uniref:1-phosphatidylinositol-4-phosphate 5-kinase n=1 Tax=Dothidotthia symphoricarpi CBS 119687 TaxID=1392245 RepID=A0A6A6AGA2_9PLEO|nr:SAICAR synthase-like protein [Dothidotthia symphoricarpi CBS 119687]KAF2130068.1 SAICAR synthase-like protein [Dothidotthia symphoricarpi CBS 119687]
MPSHAADTSDHAPFPTQHSPFGLPLRTSSDRAPAGRENGERRANGSAAKVNGSLPNGAAVMQSVPNGRPAKPSSRTSHDEGPDQRDDGYFASVYSADTQVEEHCGTTKVKMGAMSALDGTKEARKDFAHAHAASPGDATPGLQVPSSVQQRVSAPPAFNQAPTSPAPNPYRLQQRHTLEVPKLSTSRTRDTQNNTDDVVTASGRFSPTSRHRKGSMSLVRRNTRSVNSDVHLDEVPQDEDAARWAEHIRNKRASKRKRKEDEDEDRVVVGTKVDQHHVNWVTAYNMLTGIRFTVSRTNAKMDRDLTDADFDAKHKFSFDMYVPHGFPLMVKNLLSFDFASCGRPYDFKFKDYAPWVFRHLRNTFKLDPADYLVSLTSKYILSELGSPGKSGSFFYFSRDYKYIIKTIHHAEHKFLRKILKDYYNHVQDNPNTLLSQFYGLHRVKIPYGRKIHFVVMNNLFPPHRDIHTTFDLKGSTIGRDFKEEGLASNPRATLKDLNWLRRNLQLEFGPTKKSAFIEQMQRDVKLLQRLHIMDYSLLVGVHDLEKGNEENLRDKTLQVFQPGGDTVEDPQPGTLMRTPSKLESARKARELRQMVKTQKPVPMDATSFKMPDEMADPKKNFYFYSDDGGFQATHEDNTPAEEVYYLGIIDCLTHYSFIKRAEHFFKGLTNTESQISAIPPERYGDRFIKFISGNTKSRELAEREKNNEVPRDNNSFMEKAEHQVDRSRQHGHTEANVPNREMRAVRSPSAERGEIGTILPIVEEAGESSSVGGRSNRSTEGSGHMYERTHATPPPPLQEYDLSSLQPLPRSREQSHGRPPPTPPKDSGTASEERPPTPAKDDAYRQRLSGPPTPPKELRGRSPARNKELPRTPLETTIRVN